MRSILLFILDKFLQHHSIEALQILNITRSHVGASQVPTDAKGQLTSIMWTIPVGSRKTRLFCKSVFVFSVLKSLTWYNGLFSWFCRNCSWKSYNRKTSAVISPKSLIQAKVLYVAIRSIANNLEWIWCVAWFHMWINVWCFLKEKTLNEIYSNV